MLRDISSNGAGFESDVPLVIGEKVRVTWGSFDLAEAEVIWSQGKQFGLNLPVGELVAQSAYLNRAVRVPISLPATIYLNGERHNGELLNISQAGASVALSCDVTRGALATICCGDHTFENAEVKWARDGVVGFRLARLLTIAKMKELLIDCYPKLATVA